MVSIAEYKPETVADYEFMVTLRHAIYPEHPTTAQSYYDEDQRWPSEFVKRRFVAKVEDEPVGMGTLQHLVYMHHPQRFGISVSVLPDYRHRGIGTALYEYMLTLARDEYNANQFHTWTIKPEGIAFAQNHGFKEVMRASESRLETADFDFSRFNGIEAKIADKGIQVRTIAELCREDPDALRKQYELEAAIEDDIPATREITFVTYEQWIKGRDESNPEYLPDAQYIAIQNGKYVGVSSLWGNQASDKLLYVGVTGVLSEARRQGIATALKLRTIRFAEAHSKCTIVTWNEENNPMLDLNLKLGFVQQQPEIELVMHLNE